MMRIGSIFMITDKCEVTERGARLSNRFIYNWFDLLFYSEVSVEPKGDTFEGLLIRPDGDW